MVKVAKTAKIVNEGLLITFSDGTTHLEKGETDLRNINKLFDKLEQHKPENAEEVIEDEEAILSRIKRDK